MSLTLKQWAGIAAAAGGLAVLWGPAAWSWLRERVKVRPAPEPEQNVDPDYLDLLALRRLQNRAADLGCKKFRDAILQAQQCFFGCLETCPDVDEN